jgi:transcriptional regulator with XRE-family HTH domain
MTDDPEIELIRAAMQERGLSQADAGRVLGLDSSQITRTFKGTRRLQLHEARKLRDWLGLDAAAPPVAGSIAVMPGLVPLYGWVGAASEDRLTIAEQNLLGAVPIHPAQANVREPFALQVQDESMMPRYEPGEIVYLAPNRWPPRGKYLVLETTDGLGYLKQLLRREADRVVLHQLNPDQDLVFENDRIRAVHAVVGSG